VRHEHFFTGSIYNRDSLDTTEPNFLGVSHVSSLITAASNRATCMASLSNHQASVKARRGERPETEGLVYEGLLITMSLEPLG
jgi:hypothetical protein